MKLWDLEDLCFILQRYPEYLSEFLQAMRGLRIEKIMLKCMDINWKDWKTIREIHLKKLRQAYFKDGIVLFTGAGVSLSANMPGWRKLIYKLLVSMINNKLMKKTDFSEEEENLFASFLLKHYGGSPLIEARYIRAGLRKKFHSEVSKILYSGLDEEGRGTSPLLKAICNLCVPKKGVKAIVNYNYDDLIEQHLKEHGVSCVPIYRDVDIASQEKLGVFHVHGFLPRGKNIEQYDELEESLLVLSEEIYHKILADPYSWNNIIQINFFHDSTCLLLGLSLTDPSLRRLLDIAARKKSVAQHYVFLERLNLAKFKKHIGAIEGKMMDDEVVNAFLLAHHRLQENSFRELGLNILWVEDFNEIPGLIDSIGKKNS